MQYMLLLTNSIINMTNKKNVAAKCDDVLMPNVILTSKHVKGYAVHSRLAIIHQLLGKLFYILRTNSTTDVQNTLGVCTRS